MDKVFHHTQALCHICGAKVMARTVERAGEVYLEKFCPDDGPSEVLISSDAGWYRESRGYVKPNQAPLLANVQEFEGCPDSCGFCGEHLQHTCLPVIEITSDCNLSCPVCLKRFGERLHLELGDFENIVDELIACEGKMDVVNLSGGEPTLHPELESFLLTAKSRGIMQTTVSTNGLLFLNKPELRRVFRETGALAALQFDGFRPETSLRLRGRDLSREKREIIDLLENEKIRYSLVATVAKGVNDDEIGAVTDFFFSSEAVSLMFQPISLTGSAGDFSREVKLTVPDVIDGIAESHHVKREDFNPLPCSHYSCFALAYYLLLEEKRFMNMKDFLGIGDYLDIISNRALPGLDSRGFDIIQKKVYDLWSLTDSGSLGNQALKRIKAVLRELGKDGFSSEKAFKVGVESMKGIFIHDFMDVHTFDFGRLIKCCTPYPQADGRFVPMCAQNVLFQEGWNG